MTTRLLKGEKKPLRDLGIDDDLVIDVDFGLAGLDIAAFGLDASRRIADDRYTILFNNLASPERAIEMVNTADSSRITIELGRLPATIDRVVITATHDTTPVSASVPLVATFSGKASYNAAEGLGNELALMIAEVYRHSSGWRIGTIGQGFNGGLAQLVRHFGGEVAGDVAPTTPTSSRPPAPTPAPPPTPTPTPVPTAGTVSLSKIRLEKKQVVNLEKKGDSFGDVILNLNWNQGGGMFGAGSGVDLDLGCLYELQDGSKGVVQALGDAFGDFDYAPFIELSGDDRTGSVAGGETIRINGRRFDQIRKLAVFAFIYEGAPSWDRTDGVVTIKAPNQPELEVRLDGGQTRRNFCGIASIENDRGTMKVSRIVEYYPGHKHFADEMGIYLNWTRGTKD